MTKDEFLNMFQQCLENGDIIISTYEYGNPNVRTQTGVVVSIRGEEVYRGGEEE